mmetsp:Transcript_14332/g.10365  ORF Transcript_14332/g.10365 Transcript_14332/m.10365 type:complete len:125 (+) Transcript_14332:61-435(+)
MFEDEFEDKNVSDPCSRCEENLGLENWICLRCKEVNCSRYVRSHALEHYNETQHPIAFSFADFSYWCYICDSYVVNRDFLTHTERFYSQKFSDQDSTAQVLAKIKECKYEDVIKEEEDDEQQND